MQADQSNNNALIINADGWCANVTHIPSPNFNARPSGTNIDLLVIHNISLPPGQFGGHYIQDFFCNQLDHQAHSYFEHLQNTKVSAHFLIMRDGQIIQFVSTLDRAWHAGASSFEGRTQCNDFSIGIELEGSDFEAFTPLQYAALMQLTHALQTYHSITNVCGHQHIAPNRKTDPGPFFDWTLYQQLMINLNQHARAKSELSFPNSQA